MKTNEFISELRRAPENQLVFVNGNGHTARAGYHLTELKAASLDTVVINPISRVSHHSMKTAKDSCGSMEVGDLRAIVSFASFQG